MGLRVCVQARRIRRLEKKLADARGEIDDLTNEAQQERQHLLESIRDQNREMKLLEQVLGMLLPSKEIAKVSICALQFLLVY